MALSFLLFCCWQIFLHQVFAATPILGVARNNFGHTDLDKGSPFSTIIQFDENTKNENNEYPPEFMSAEKLLRLGVVAFNEMAAAYNELIFVAPKDRPNAMVLFAGKNQIYSASSMRNDPKTYCQPGAAIGATPGAQELIRNAMATFEIVVDVGHRNNLSCGEPSILDL